MEPSTLHAVPLSLQQARLWQWQHESQAYHAVSALYVDGPVSIEMLRQAIQLIVEQNEILRTVFYCLPTMDVPMQVVMEAQFGWQETSLAHLPSTDQQTQINELLQQWRSTTWDVAQLPALQTHLLTLHEQRHLLLLRLPALSADTSTLYQIVHELGIAYATCVAHQKPVEEPLQYSDVSNWQNELLVEEDGKDYRLFWRHIDLTGHENFQLPGATSAQNKTFQPEIYPLPLEKALVSSLENLAETLHVTSETVMLAAWQLFLSSLTHQEEVVVGVGYDGRYYDDLKSALGLYTRFAPLPAIIEPETTFVQLIEQIDKIYRQSLEAQTYFTWSLVENADERLQQLPVQFVSQQWPASVEHAHVRFSLKQSSTCVEPFLLKLEMLQSSASFHLNLHFDASRLGQQAIEDLASVFQVLLQDALNRSQIAVKMLHLLLPWQETRLRAQFRGPVTDFPALTVVELFEQQAFLRPEAPALKYNDDVLSYYELNRRSNRLAHFLRAQGVQQNTIVGLCVSRSLEMVVGLLAILKAGGAYVPLDPQFPSARLRYQLSDTNAPLVVTQSALQDLFIDYTGTIVLLDSPQPTGAPEWEENLPSHSSLNDLAYVMYTSGSTGQPKGVLIQHKNVSNYIQSMRQQLMWQAGSQFATVSTVAADLGNTVIFGSLVSGGCLHILDYETVTSTQRWREYIQRYPLDVLKIVPSHLSALLTTDVPAEQLLPRQQLILGGEAFTGTLLARLAELGAFCEIINHYGPTETTIGVLYHRLGRNKAQWKHAAEKVIPLGKPLHNLEAVILNIGGQLVPIGVIGELAIAGAGVAQGYLHQPEQNAAKFIEKTWGQNETLRYYRTGDLARYRHDGTIEFVSRVDTQVKLRGYRVELGEIEQVLSQHDQIQECVVLLQEDAPDEQHLVAYVVTRYGGILDEKDMKSFLQKRLPAYMVPNSLVCLVALPLTANGKIDRKLLSKQEQVNTASQTGNEEGMAGQSFLRPRDYIEVGLASIWEQILHKRPIGVRDNFFDVGGNSISAVRLMSLIQHEFSSDLSLSLLFKHPTLEALASILRQKVGVEPASIVVPLQTGGQNIPFFCVHPSGGTVFRYQALARALGEEQPFYGLQAPEWSEDDSHLEAIAARYVREIREVQPVGPYQIGGWSLGGVIAFEIAQQLRQQGENVLLLALIDSSVPPSFWQENPQPKPDEPLNDARVADLLQEEGFVTFTLEDPHARLEEAWKRAKQMGRIPEDTSFTQFRRVAYINCGHLLAVKYYRPVVYNGPIVFFRSSEALSLETTQGVQRPDCSPGGGWEKLSTYTPNVYVIQSKHSEMVDEPYLQELALPLKQLLYQNSHSIYTI